MYSVEYSTQPIGVKPNPESGASVPGLCAFQGYHCYKKVLLGLSFWHDYKEGV